MINREEYSEREEYLKQFRKGYKEEFEGLLEFLEELGPIPPDPSSLGMSDGRNFEELDEGELEEIKNVLYETLGIEQQYSNSEVRRYESQADPQAKVPGKIEIRVLKTNRPNTFLQEMTFSDGATRWVIGPDINI